MILAQTTQENSRGDRARPIALSAKLVKHGISSVEELCVCKSVFWILWKQVIGRKEMPVDENCCHTVFLAFRS